MLIHGDKSSGVLMHGIVPAAGSARSSIWRPHLLERPSTT